MIDGSLRKRERSNEVAKMRNFLWSCQAHQEAPPVSPIRHWAYLKPLKQRCEVY